MSRRIHALPTRGAAPTTYNTALPPYIAQQQQRTDSTNSQDSILTQVPLAYHMPPAQQQQFMQQDAYGGEVNRYQGRINGGNGFGQRGMNPITVSFAANEGFLHQAANGYAHGHGGFDGRAQNGNSFQHGGPVYQNGGNDGGFGQGMDGAQRQQYAPQNQYGAQTPYSHYGQGGSIDGYDHFNNGSVQDTDAGYQNFNYASAGQGQHFQNGKFGHNGGHNGSNMTYQVSQRQAQGYGNGNGFQNRQYPVQIPYINPKDANRGRSSFGKQIKLNVEAQPYQPSSNLSSMSTVVDSFTPHTPSKRNSGSTNYQYGGAVQSPKTNPSSPTKSHSKASTRESSQERSSSHTSQANHRSLAGSPTPIARAPPSSEPRNAVTPTLRSRRERLVVGSATDPSHKQKMANWLENIPVDAGGGQQAQSQTQHIMSPPKMSSLLHSGGNEHVALSPIVESDPFTDQPVPVRPLTAMSKLNNPFAPTANMMSPYAGNDRLPQPTMSASLRALTNNGACKPELRMAMDSLPFVEYCRLARVDTWGVVKIKNIPYSVNRPEVLAFLGRNARIISEQDYEPVHIVMERVTSKTLDCYVEFVNLNEAVNAVNRFEQNRTGGRGGRLGQRHVEVELSGQEQLMADLFPKAKNVTWNGSHPVIQERDMSDPYNSGFQGFISKEELVMLVKHVEAPQRSPFSKDCPQRPFECLISTLLKYPWYMVDYITIEDRNQLYNVTMQLIDLLQERINSEHENINLTPMLLKRVWRAAIKCPGFSPAMKDDIAFKCGIEDSLARETGVPDYAPFYKDLWTIGPKPGVPTDVVLYYAALIRETLGPKTEMSLAERAARGPDSASPSLFGDLVSLIGHPRDHEKFQSYTMQQCAAAEWAAIEKVLRRALTPSLAAGLSQEAYQLQLHDFDPCTAQSSLSAPIVHDYWLI